MKKQNLTDAVRVIPVVVIHDLAQTVPTLEALRDGGIPQRRSRSVHPALRRQSASAGSSSPRCTSAREQ